MRIFRIYCSAAYDHVTRIGASAFIVTEDNRVLEQRAEKESVSSPNKTEMMAVLNGLESIHVHGAAKGDRVFVYMSFRPVCDAFEKGWIAKWQENGWMNRDGLPVRHKETWEAIHGYTLGMSMDFRYTKRDDMGMLEKLKKRARVALRSVE